MDLYAVANKLNTGEMIDPQCPHDTLSILSFFSWFCSICINSLNIKSGDMINLNFYFHRIFPKSTHVQMLTWYTNICI